MLKGVYCSVYIDFLLCRFIITINIIIVLPYRPKIKVHETLGESYLSLCVCNKRTCFFDKTKEIF